MNWKSNSSSPAIPVNTRSDLVSKMEASQHFLETTPTSNRGNLLWPAMAISAGDAVEFHISALYVPEAVSPAPNTATRSGGTP